MDRKSKKQLEVARKRLQKLQMQLSGARQQEDDPGEVQQIEEQLVETRNTIAKLKSA